MSKKEVENLSNEDLIEEWEQTKAVMKSSLPGSLDYMQGWMFFAHWVNVSQEVRKRKL